MDYVRPSLAVTMGLILTLDTYKVTNCLHSVNQCFHGSCLPANSTMAETNCRQQSGAIFTFDDLKMSYGLAVLESAILDVGAVWIDNTGDACRNNTAGNKSHICCVVINSNGTNVFQPANCTDLYHYVCNMNSRTQHLYVPCLNETSSTRIAVIIVCTSLTITMAVAGITVWCYCRLNKPPKRYAVRVESAIYHRQHPDPHNKEECRVADTSAADNLTPESDDIIQEHTKGAKGDDYDTLCRTGSTESNVLNHRSDVTPVYGHLCGQNNLHGWTTENHYDTTSVPLYDRRTVDKIYDRTHASDR
ncbi:uncharacterized protein LOC124136829 isoform X2 [Haliotis rufescens]|uniref:uncharacterized protein LOC124136829 isoform X2 n=1 Tax=Haliotis rufescens TaxID=6454 RepID=UPI00201EA871|nr:uncharacterized protein LOC124136829 isoform X2 [Haliotis rufescens]